MRVATLILLWSACVLANAQDTGGLQVINGAKLFVKTIGKGEVVIVVHGGPGLSHDYFLPQLQPLAKRCQLFFYDQRASGRSSIPSSDSLSLQFFIQDIESIRRSVAAEKVTIIAHSWGALLAVNYAHQFKHRMKHLVLVNPVPLSKEYDQEMQLNQRAKFTPSDSTDRSIILGSPAFKAGKGSAIRNLLLFSFRHSFYEPRNLAKLNLEVQDNYRVASQSLYRGLGSDLVAYNFYDMLKGFEFPVLMIHGSTDSVPLSALTRMHDLAPQSTLLIYHKSGHFAFIDQQKKFLADVRDFIAE